MAETKITRRDAEKSWDKPTDERHRFRLKEFQCHILEVRDAHFNFDSAVLLPDRATEAGGASPEPSRITGLAVLRAALKHSKDNGSQKLLVLGHTDTTGAAGYNLTLSQQRADNVRAALAGDKDKWVQISQAKHNVEDYQLILKWANDVQGWGCDPGPIDNHKGPKTEEATKQFQKMYNEDFGKSISEDGKVGKQTWEAFFDVYMDVLKEILDTDEAGLQAMQDGLQFVDGRKSLGCGENFPIEEPRQDNYRSVTNRRVEILFFDPGEEPKLDCHPGPGRCSPKKCELYNHVIYQFNRIDPEPIRLPLHKIVLELGDIDKLFPAIATKDSSDRGVRRRLQAVGYLYEPLAGATPAVIDQRCRDAFDHFKKITGKADNAAACDELQRLVKETIVDTGKLPEKGKFGMLRLPGGFCVVDYDFFGSRATFNHYQGETDVWRNNPSLGLIPILAKVQIYRRRKWTPGGSGKKVHFQLVKPDDVPDGDAVKAPALGNTAIGGKTASLTFINTVPPPNTVQRQFTLTSSPQKYVDTEKKRNPVVADDPQVDNAHKNVGGKRGNTVAGTNRLENLLEITTTRTGFNDTLKLTAAAASSHPNAVTADSNVNGEACLIFMPAWPGGDRYRIKAFLDPVLDQPSDGTEGFAVTAEIGTLVVWRSLRFSKYLRWQYPAGVTTAQKDNCFRTLDAFDTTGVLTTEYKKAYLDVVVEDDAKTPQTISQAEWRNAMRFAKADVQRQITAGSLTLRAGPYHLDTLLPDTTSTAGVNNPSPAILHFRTAEQYDAAIAGVPAPTGFASWPSLVTLRNTAAPPAYPGDPGPYYDDMGRLFHATNDEFLRYFTKNAIAGVTIIQAPAVGSFYADRVGTPISAHLAGLPVSPWGNSGWGKKYRGCYVIFGRDAYLGEPPRTGFPWMPYDHTHNTMHETGHVLYGVHQYTGTSRFVDANEHDYHDLCIMGYQRGATAFCGRCVLNQGGWKTQAMPSNMT